jgi:polysaccharide pyruvyl transferase WcaK-like protein
VSDAPRVVILDAYRRDNAGDGLLVDETARIIREALPGAKITLISMDPSSFAEFPDGLHPIGGASKGVTFAGLLARALTRRAHPDVISAVTEAEVAIAVGGGYIRAESLTAGLKSFLSHMVQTPTRTTARTPHFYLPQSIGPLPARPIPFGVGRLRNAALVCVRDDRSLAELSSRGVSASRLPDLAILSMADKPIVPLVPAASPRPVLVARALRGNDKRYRASLQKLRDLADFDIAIQSSGAGNNDPQFYGSMGWAGPTPRLLDLVNSSTPPSAVVSVRLHGSLQSILAGVPSVHLSYERKGWGAYDDLGIADYVHHAWRFDPYRVADQVEELIADAGSYWAQVNRRTAEFGEMRRSLINAIRDAAHRS